VVESQPVEFRPVTVARFCQSASGVTAPRQIVEGTSYLVSRRCTQRDLLLTPSALTSAIFKYTLAVAATRHGLLLHAFCAMSNHYHLVVTDPRANLPAFSQLLDAVLAKALNALHGRWESFWAPGSYSAVALATPEDIVEKVAYTLANPAAAHLVDQGRQWPGAWSDPQSIGAPGELVARPEHYFAKNGAMPERETLVLSVPPGFASAEDFRARVLARLEEREKAAAEVRTAEGTSVLGVHAILKQRHTDRPATGEPRRGLNPRIASRDKWRRIEALERLKGFLARHREALLRFMAGDRGAVFPHGTYLMRVRFGVACASG
jgi:putative transposase